MDFFYMERLVGCKPVFIFVIFFLDSSMLILICAKLTFFGFFVVKITSACCVSCKIFRHFHLLLLQEDRTLGSFFWLLRVFLVCLF